MARYEKEFGASVPEPLSLTQLLELLGAADDGDHARNDAVACFLAGGAGWKDALQQLRGAFADGEQGLIDDQSE